MQQNVAIVSLTNIISNAKKAKRLCGGKKLFCVVKANAYGHGLIPVANALTPYADGFVVANIYEGIALRTAGVSLPVLVLSPPVSEEEAAYLSLHRLIATVSSFACLDIVRKTAREYPLTAHIKVNTGMNRLGVGVKDVEKFLKRTKEIQGLTIGGMFSHLYSTDVVNCYRQRALFLQAQATAFRTVGKLCCHLSATGGLLLGKDFLFDGARVGLGLYGYTPSGKKIFRPSMKLYTCVEDCHLFTGGGVGYQRAGKNYRYLSTIRTGYADGFHREGTFRIIGNMCMDKSVIEGKNRLGKYVKLFSFAESEAQKNGVSVYELLCNCTRRAHFEYR